MHILNKKNFKNLVFLSLFSLSGISTYKIEAYNKYIQDEKIKFGFDVGLLGGPLGFVLKDFYGICVTYDILPMTLFFEYRFANNYIGIRTPITFTYSYGYIDEQNRGIFRISFDPHFRFYPGDKRNFAFFAGISNFLILNQRKILPLYSGGLYLGLGSSSKHGFTSSFNINPTVSKKKGFMLLFITLNIVFGWDISKTLKNK